MLYVPGFYSIATAVIFGVIFRAQQPVNLRGTYVSARETMLIINARIHTLAASQGVSPEQVTQWLWTEFFRQEDSLVEDAWDRAEDAWSPEVTNYSNWYRARRSQRKAKGQYRPWQQA